MPGARPPLTPQLQKIGLGPLGRKKLKKLKTVPRNEESKENEICSICLKDCTKEAFKLPCKHLFHTACIEPWFKASSLCPNCRNDCEK